MIGIFITIYGTLSLVVGFAIAFIDVHWILWVVSAWSFITFHLGQIFYRAFQTALMKQVKNGID